MVLDYELVVGDCLVYFLLLFLLLWMFVFSSRKSQDFITWIADYTLDYKYAVLLDYEILKCVVIYNMFRNVQIMNLIKMCCNLACFEITKHAIVQIMILINILK